MSFGDAIKTCFGKYADFSGRARRSEYWFWILFTILVDIVTGIVDGVIGTYPLLYVLAAVALLLPTLAAGIRRLHDTGRSGWYVLMGLIPLVGGIILLVFACQDSDADNEYGPSPKGATGYGGPAGYTSLS